MQAQDFTTTKIHTYVIVNKWVQIPEKTVFLNVGHNNYILRSHYIWI
jgi:hypothetical protein